MLQEAQDFLDYYRDVLAKDKMIMNKGIYKRCTGLLLMRILCTYPNWDPTHWQGPVLTIMWSSMFQFSPSLSTIDTRLTGLDEKVLPVRRTMSFCGWVHLRALWRVSTLTNRQPDTKLNWIPLCSVDWSSIGQMYSLKYSLKLNSKY